jgi:LDH2 family malate/lactate/ureidoglycolate dehydrogenase
MCVKALEKIGVDKENAEIVADCLVKADLYGISSHGVARLPTYVERAKRGLIELHPEIRVIRENSSIAVLDGGNGFGQVVGVKAMDLAVEKARRTGIGAVSVYNSNHFGIAAYYSIRALKHSMIGIAMSNTAPAMAPWGGAKSILGTNPISFAIPSSHQPIILDMATSKVARGKIRIALEKGEKIPEGWAIDELGLPTTDPAKAMKGCLLPIEGPKGSGLSLVVDILSGVLSGGSFGRDVGSTEDFSRPTRISHFMIAINISNFIPLEYFMTRIDKLITEIKNCPRAPNIERIYLPGEIELEEEKRRLKEGIPIDDNTFNKLLNLL